MSPEKRLYDQYPVHTIEGVRRLFEDIHRIRAARLTKTDYNVSNLLIDFQRAIEQAGLTRRQARALYWYYERDLTEREAARKMGVSRQTLSEYIEKALRKIAAVFEEWGYFQE